MGARLLWESLGHWERVCLSVLAWDPQSRFQDESWYVTTLLGSAVLPGKLEWRKREQGREERRENKQAYSGVSCHSWSSATDCLIFSERPHELLHLRMICLGEKVKRIYLLAPRTHWWKLYPSALTFPVHYMQGHPVGLVTSHSSEAAGEPQGRKWEAHGMNGRWDSVRGPWTRTVPEVASQNKMRPQGSEAVPKECLI